MKYTSLLSITSLHKRFIRGGWLSLWIIALGLAGCEEPPPERLSVIWNNNRYGYLNLNGDVVISVQFDYAFPFSEGLGGVNVGGKSRNRRIPPEGKWGFVDHNGRYIINPQYYSPPESGAPYDYKEFARVQHQGYIFSEGLAAVRTESEWIYINTKNEVVIRNPRIESPRIFSHGLANVFVGNRWGYINHAGEFVIEPQFLYPADFEDGLALVVNSRGRRMIIDTTGRVFLPQYQIETPFHEGVARALPRFRGEPPPKREERHHILVDLEGRFLFDPEFDQVGRYGSGMVPVLVGSIGGDPLYHPEKLKPTEELGGRWGFANAQGRIVRNPQYEDAKGFSEGIAAVKRGGLWAYVDENFNRLTDFEFRWADFYRGGMSQVRLGPTHGDYDGRYAFINKDGEIIWIEPQ